MMILNLRRINMKLGGSFVILFYWLRFLLIRYSRIEKVMMMNFDLQ